MHYLKRSLLALSVGLNIAFVLFWGLQYFSGPDRSSTETARNQGNRPFTARYEGVQVTPEQWKALEPFALAFKTNTDRIRRETMEQRERMLALLLEPAVDEQDIRDVQQRILVNQGRMKEEVLRLLLHEKSVLRPDQFAGLIKAIRNYSGRGLGFGAMTGGNTERN